MDTIKIYSKPFCPYCVKAKTFLKSHEVAFEEIEMDPLSDDYEAQRDRLVADTNHRTFPFIFVGKTFLGGYQELLSSFQTLRFHELCKDVGIHVPMDF